jgi:hypothetical protein
VAQHIVGVRVAYKNKIDLSMAISLGESMQVALFVAALLVFISLLFGPEPTLFFSLFEVAALGFYFYRQCRSPFVRDETYRDAKYCVPTCLVTLHSHAKHTPSPNIHRSGRSRQL